MFLCPSIRSSGEPTIVTGILGVFRLNMLLGHLKSRKPTFPRGSRGHSPSRHGSGDWPELPRVAVLPANPRHSGCRYNLGCGVSARSVPMNALGSANTPKPAAVRLLPAESPSQKHRNDKRAYVWASASDESRWSATLPSAPARQGQTHRAGEREPRSTMVAAFLIVRSTYSACRFSLPLWVKSRLWMAASIWASGTRAQERKSRMRGRCGCRRRRTLDSCESCRCLATRLNTFRATSRPGAVRALDDHGRVAALSGR